MSETHLVPDFGDHDDFDDSHQDYLDAERDAEILPDPTEPPEPDEHTTPAVDLESWDNGRQPTRAVAAAALLLGDADTIDASCYGWVPQAYAALAAALDGPEPAQVLGDWDARFLDEFDTGEPGRADLLLAMKAALSSNRRHRVRAMRAALLGEEAA